MHYNKYLVISLIIVSTFLFTSYKKAGGTNSCITIENFSELKAYVTKNGVPIKLFNRVIADTVTLAKEVNLVNKHIELIEDVKQSQIIIIDEKGKIPTYFLTLKNRKLVTSAYYSLLETTQIIAEREKDFCELIAKLRNRKMPNCRPK